MHHLKYQIVNLSIPIRKQLISVLVICHDICMTLFLHYHYNLKNVIMHLALGLAECFVLKEVGSGVKVRTENYPPIFAADAVGRLS